MNSGADRGYPVVALSGGVGGAKLTAGLAGIVPADQLMLIANTGDDFEHLGLHISPDIDTLLYTLAGINDPERGWGRVDETWTFMEALQRLGGDDWFRLGDKDLATHVFRTQALGNGLSLSEVTERLASRLCVEARIVPMTNDPVRTVVESELGSLSFQTYFVRHRCEPRIERIRFSGCETARPPRSLLVALEDPRLSAVILCPSNPFLSIDPILSVPGIRDALIRCSAPIIAVSPIVGGRSLKGPTASIMSDFGLDVSATTVAKAYADFLTGMLIDSRDRSLICDIESLGVSVRTADIVMQSDRQKREVAHAALGFAEALDSRARSAERSPSRLASDAR